MWFNAFKEMMDFFIKKKTHSWSVWIQNFSPTFSHGIISNINLQTEDLQTIELESRMYL